MSSPGGSEYMSQSTRLAAYLMSRLGTSPSWPSPLPRLHPHLNSAPCLVEVASPSLNTSPCWVTSRILGASLEHGSDRLQTHTLKYSLPTSEAGPQGLVPQSWDSRATHDPKRDHHSGLAARVEGIIRADYFTLHGGPTLTSLGLETKALGQDMWSLISRSTPTHHDSRGLVGSMAHSSLKGAPHLKESSSPYRPHSLL